MWADVGLEERLGKAGGSTSCPKLGCKGECLEQSSPSISLRGRVSSARAGAVCRCWGPAVTVLVLPMPDPCLCAPGAEPGLLLAEHSSGARGIHGSVTASSVVSSWCLLHFVCL